MSGIAGIFLGRKTILFPQKKNGLTRQELRELEAKEKTEAQRLAEKVIQITEEI